MTEISTAAFLAALKQKKFFGNNTECRPWIIGGGGALNGAHLAGIQVALVEAGLHKYLAGVVGVSTSIPALGYLLAAETGDAEHHLYQTTVYSDEARSRNFLRWNLSTDVKWLRSVFEGLTGKPILYENVVSSGVRFVGVTTEWETGLPHYIEPKSRQEFFGLIEAGCSMPGLAPPVLLNGRLMTDSVAGDPCPVPWLMSLPVEERPTHILIVANAWHEPPERKRQLRDWKISRRLFNGKVPNCVIDGFVLRHRRFHRNVKAALAMKGVQVAVEWLPWPQQPLDRDPEKIKALTTAGYERFSTLLQEGGS